MESMDQQENNMRGGLSMICSPVASWMSPNSVWLWLDKNDCKVSRTVCAYSQKYGMYCSPTAPDQHRLRLREHQCTNLHRAAGRWCSMAKEGWCNSLGRRATSIVWSPNNGFEIDFFYFSFHNGVMHTTLMPEMEAYDQPYSLLKMRPSVVATHYKCCSSCLTLLHTQCML